MTEKKVYKTAISYEEPKKTGIRCSVSHLIRRHGSIICLIFCFAEMMRNGWILPQLSEGGEEN